jgi:hypothetical protein
VIVVSPKPVAATLAMTLAATFLLLLSILHVARPDMAPSSRMISEYANGPVGWMMSAAFFALAGAMLALMLALRPIARGWLGAAGLLLLLSASVGFAMGGLFPTDPASTPPEDVSRTGRMHGVSFMLGVPSVLLGVTFINARLWQDPGWRPSRLLLLSTAAFVWSTMIVFGVSMATFIARGANGPELVVGWQNRAVVLAWALWVITLSWRIRQASRQQGPGERVRRDAPRHLRPSGSRPRRARSRWAL